MMFAQILISLILAAAAGFLFARFLLTRPQAAKAGAANLDSERAAIEAERDRLRVELEETRRHPQELAEAEARLDHLKSELEAARARIEQLEAEAASSRAPAPRQAAALTAPDEEPAGSPPERLDGPDGDKDNLKRINGVGPGTERTLNGLGIYHFRQIAGFTPENVAWVDRHLAFRGRIEREDWVGQAKALSRGSGADDGGPAARTYGGNGDPAQV